MADEVKNEKKKKSARGAGKAPSRKQINFIKKEVQSVDVGKRILAIVLTAVILVLAGGYAFMRWSTVSGLRRQVGQLQDELTSMKLISATYDEINAEYVRWSTAYESEAERLTQDSRVLIDKARELVEPYGYITNIAVEGNTLKLTVYSMDISEVTDSLNNDPDGLVVMVIPLAEQKDREAEGNGPQSAIDQPAAPSAPAETATPADPNAPASAADSQEVTGKVRVESMASFQLIFADKEKEG